jgi:hypothetical protein
VCPVNGTSSPSPLRSGGFRRTTANRLRSARTEERAAAAVPVGLDPAGMTRHRDQPTRLLLAPGALGGCLGRRGGRQSRYLANTLGSLDGLRDALLGQESDDVLRKVRARVADSSYEAFADDDAPVNRGIEQDTRSGRGGGRPRRAAGAVMMEHLDFGPRSASGGALVLHYVSAKRSNTSARADGRERSGE